MRLMKVNVPKEAACVKKVLRADVPKPKTLPKLRKDSGVLRWIRKKKGETKLFCPMGFHPLSTSTHPYFSPEFADGACDNDSVAYFAGWWDKLTLAQAKDAIDAIWG